MFLLSYAHPPLFYPDRKVQTIKDLEKPWAALTPRRLRPSSPTLVDPKMQATPSWPVWRGHSPATTLLLDDSHAKAALQPYNHLCVQEYTRTQRNADLAVLQLERAMQQQQQLQQLQQQQQRSSVSHQERFLASATASATTDTNAHEHAPDGTGTGTGTGTTTTEKEQAHKRKRKKKKDPSQAQTLQQLAAFAADGASPGAFDETLLAVIGILHAARLQSSIAGWLRAGALSFPLSSERSSTSVMGDAKTWCDDPVLVRAWASCGREAMHDLGLNVEHGIES